MLKPPWAARAASRLLKNARPSRTGRRSLTARMDIPAGTVLTQEHLDYARPGDGLPPSLDTLLIGRRTVHAKARGERFTLADIS